MRPDLLILRPQPGAAETAARAAVLGLTAVQAPLFTIVPLPWQAPDPDGFEAVLLTSANAVRQAGPGLAAYLHLPAYAVGETTAAAAGAAGFAAVQSGPWDGNAVVKMLVEQGVARAFHPCGRDLTALDPAAIAMEDVPVYAADAVTDLPADARDALSTSAIALLHSPRAARLFAKLVDGAGLARGGIAVAAISEAAAAAAGTGWSSSAIATRPRDDALLEVAAKLCQKASLE